jgi:hypothetical protein
MWYKDGSGGSMKNQNLDRWFPACIGIAKSTTYLFGLLGFLAGWNERIGYVATSYALFLYGYCIPVLVLFTASIIIVNRRYALIIENEPDGRQQVLECEAPLWMQIVCISYVGFAMAYLYFAVGGSVSISAANWVNAPPQTRSAMFIGLSTFSAGSWYMLAVPKCIG